ncbi:hypothetical protein [Streptomyces fungicidicus]|uniref:hypothetical protein n=1 Tax=Streptomyces fungicidicus TaxID=68203 RepID=UPI0038254B70
MFEYALHRLRHDDLVRRAEQDRLAREVLRLRRAARHQPPTNPEPPHPRTNFTRAA